MNEPNYIKNVPVFDIDFQRRLGFWLMDDNFPADDGEGAVADCDCGKDCDGRGCANCHCGGSSVEREAGCEENSDQGDYIRTVGKDYREVRRRDVAESRNRERKQLLEKLVQTGRVGSYFEQRLAEIDSEE